MKKKLLLGHILQKLAPKIGATVVIEPEWGIAGQITMRNGKRHYFRYSSLDINSLGASEIAKDKDYANFFMKRMGYPTIPGKTFFAPHWCKAIGSQRDADSAYRYATKIGFPVIVKPNSGSQGVRVFKVHAKREFYQAIHAVFARDKVALVQQYVLGRDYRIVVLDGKLISAYERIPLCVVGDGKSTIRELLVRKQKHFTSSGRDTNIRLDDVRIGLCLKRQRRTMFSIPDKGQAVRLLDNANLSSGGEAIDVTQNIHSEFKKTAVRLAKDMGLRFCGVDLMIDGDIRQSPERYFIIEINAAPGLDHYVKTGREQAKIVEKMYLKVLRAME